MRFIAYGLSEDGIIVLLMLGKIDILGLIIAAIPIFWIVAPAVFVAIAWTRWVQARGQLNAAGKPINNRAFLIGQILGTISWCALLLFFIRLGETSTSDQVRGYDLIASLAAAVMTLFILPFGRHRAKWLTISGCAMILVLMFWFVSPLNPFGGWLLD